MPESSSPMLRVDPEKLNNLASAYERAADRINFILSDLDQRGRLNVPWAADIVSVEMASHYNDQIFKGEYSTYAALTKYESELRAAAETLRRMLDDYETTEADAVAAFRMPTTSSNG